MNKRQKKKLNSKLGKKTYKEAVLAKVIQIAEDYCAARWINEPYALPMVKVTFSKKGKRVSHVRVFANVYPTVDMTVSVDKTSPEACIDWRKDEIRE